jgi:hypothetical protein
VRITGRWIAALALLGAAACGGSRAGDDDGDDDGGDVDAGVLPGERDPRQQPFASASIWNTPIGSEAAYVPANLRAIPGGGWTWGLPYPDTDHLVFTPDAPMREIQYSDVGWDGGDRCPATEPENVLATVPMPDDFLVPNLTTNAAAAFLLPDERTIVQVQPLARCSAGGIGTALVRAPDGDLYGDGIEGAHGGSGLSTLGGALRVGELRPGDATGPRHALKVTLYMKEAFRCETEEACYRWPAVRGDSYAVGWYGTGDDNPNEANAALVMGALLALPPSVDIEALGLETEAARLLAWTLQNYGAYVVDDSYDAAFVMGAADGPDGSFAAQFEEDHDQPFTQTSDSGMGWTEDLQELLPLLSIVDNNAADSVGGGGTPRQPLAPELEEP